MLTSRKILEMVGKEPSRGLAGAVAFHRRDMTNGMNAQVGPNSHHRFLVEMEQTARTTPAPTAKYLHPADMARRLPASSPNSVAKTGLSPADLMWIDRLPRDPEQVSHDDAVTLAGLAREVSPMTNPADSRLVASVWTPVREVHDRRSAQVDAAAAAATPAPNVPSSTLAALADSIESEVPGLTHAEALQRAGASLDEVLTKRRQALKDRMMSAAWKGTSADLATERRTAVTRDPAIARPVRF